MVVDAVVVDAAVVAARAVVAAGTEGGAAADGSDGSAVAVAASPSAPGTAGTAALGAALSLSGAVELTSSVKPPSPPGAKVLGTWDGPQAVVDSAAWDGPQAVDSAASGRRQSAAAASLRHPSGARSPLGPRGSA